MLLLALAAAAALASGPDALDSLLAAPRTIDATRDGLSETFGKIVEESVKVVPNRHEPERLDKIWRLTFKRAEAEIYEATSVGKELLVSLTLRGRVRGFDLPVTIGMKMEEVLDSLGAPEERSDDSLTYRDRNPATPPDVVRLVFEHGKLARVEWTFWVD